jgi:N4-gp56 family major capsid protein
MTTQFTWAFDAPSGVFKNHALSSQIRKAAIAETKFMQFCKPEPGYGKKKGENVTIIRVSNLAVPTNAQLTENREIPQDDLVISTIGITVAEWGRAVPFTEFADDLASFNLENAIQRALKDQMALVMDNAAAAAFKTGKIVCETTGVNSINFDTTGTASQTSLANLNVYHVEQIRDYMFSTLHIPHYEGDDYMCLISTKGKRGIISDPAWEPWHRYTDPQAKYNSEIGRLEGIRFIEINHTTALSGSKGSGGVMGEALFFGADAVAMAIVQDPELRAEIPKDFGRSKSVAWYGILNFGQVWGDSANDGEAKVVYATSA